MPPGALGSPMLMDEGQGISQDILATQEFTQTQLQEVCFPISSFLGRGNVRPSLARHVRNARLLGRECWRLLPKSATSLQRKKPRDSMCMLCWPRMICTELFLPLPMRALRSTPPMTPMRKTRLRGGGCCLCRRDTRQNV